MMLTIKGLPTSTSYQELKRLIKQECNITDFIFDSLVMDDDGCKKVRIGVTDDGDGSHLMKYLNGYHYSGHVIRVAPVGKPNQQNPVSFDARGGYQQRNEYPNNNNFGSRVVPNDVQLPRSNSWVPNMQWGQQGSAAQVTPHAFPGQPIQTMVNNNFTPQQPRGFASGGIPQHAQNFSYAAKGNVLEVPITTVKDNFQPSGQFHHQPVPQGHFQGQGHGQSTPWTSQVQPVKPVFEKGTTGGYNQMGFNDNRQMPKQAMGNDGGYKDYDKGERRFVPPNRDQSPGRRPSRVSPDPTGRRIPEAGSHGRRLSPSGIQVRRMSPSGHQTRRMSPPGHQGRRMSPPSAGPPGRRVSPGNHGRRMSPSRMGGPVPTGRVMSPISGRRMSPSRQDMSHLRKPSPGVQGRRVSPGPYRRVSPSGPQGRRMSPPGPQGRRMSPPGPQGRRMSPSGPQGRRMSPSGPQGRRMSPPGSQGRRMSPPGPQGRRRSPTGPQGRRMSPPGAQGRRMSPTGPQGRRMSPPGPQGRRMSPPGTQGRRLSPSGPQIRRLSPSGPRMQRVSPHGVSVRRISPTARRISPGRREPSPGRRISPTDRRRVSPVRQSPGRRVSPTRRLSPKRHSPARRSVSPRRRSPLLDSQGGMRGYPPSYQQAKKLKYDDNDDDRPSHLKQVRPAYEPPTKAPNQTMYSGGYRQNVRENVQYPASNIRMETWQQSGDKPTAYPATKVIDGRMDKFDMPRGSEHIRMGDTIPKRSHSGPRDSRSPVRRDRSPFKDRYRRHSPSPRSPRRSWALEKRRSPDVREAPPPPLWPGQTSRDADFSRQNRNFSDITENTDKKAAPTWDRTSYEDKNNDRMNRRESDPEPRSFGQNNPVQENWKSVSQVGPKELFSRENFRKEERFPENIRDSHSYVSKGQFRRQNSMERTPYAENRDLREFPTKKDDQDEIHRKKDIPPRRDDFSRVNERDEREPFRANTAQLNKEIEDVYKRVAELGKKAQEYRKKENRFADDRVDQFFTPNEDGMQRGGNSRREFLSDASFQPRDVEISPRESNDEKPLDRQRESRWSAPDTSEVWRPKKILSPSVKAKRDKAAEELTRRIMNKFKDHIRDHQKTRIHDELTMSISRILFDMFKQEDISYIELIIKFNKKYDANDEQKIFEDVMSSFSSNYRKRPIQDPPEIPVKTAKLSPDAGVKDFVPQGVTEWTANPTPLVNLPVNPMHSVVGDPSTGKPLAMQVPYMINPAQMMMPATSFVPIYETPQPSLLPEKDGYTLYLCKDDFQPFHENQADELKSFVVSKMFLAIETSQGWAPDFIMKGLQSVYRYEVVAHDETSKDWLVNLDFRDFYAFNVLVYTSEELWYERAAIWLPGHSRYRHIEPLHKLKLQNRKLESVNIGKWKFVKKIVTTLGTRIYVDMPPSAARALENYKMMLSYELQKVTVFLKAVAVDKDAFDAGLNEVSIELGPSMHHSPMPALSQDPNIVKIGVKGNKSATIGMARKIKDMVVYQLFQYLLQGGNSSTDFLKFGFCSPGHLGVLPENIESKRWITGLNLGRLNRQPIVVLGGDDSMVRYIKMYVMLPNEHNTVNSALACEKLKQSNQGVKGLNFGAWKNARIADRHEGKTKLEVHMDLESVESIIKMHYELDYVDEDQDCLSVVVKSDYSRGKLEDLVKQYKAEMTDSYDVANMDIASDSDDDVVCLD